MYKNSATAKLLYTIYLWIGCKMLRNITCVIQLNSQMHISVKVCFCTLRCSIKFIYYCFLVLNKYWIQPFVCSTRVKSNNCRIRFKHFYQVFILVCYVVLWQWYLRKKVDASHIAPSSQQKQLVWRQSVTSIKLSINNTT